EEEAEPAIGEIGLVIFFDRVRHKSNASAILFAMPPCAVCSQTAGKGLVNFGVGEGFGLAVIPAEAGESGQVAGKVLLEVDAETILAGDVPGMVGDVGDDVIVFGQNDLVAIDAHVGVVSEG